jgi:hypothetical protein
LEWEKLCPGLRFEGHLVLPTSQLYLQARGYSCGLYGTIFRIVGTFEYLKNLSLLGCEVKYHGVFMITLRCRVEERPHVWISLIERTFEIIELAHTRGDSLALPLVKAFFVLNVPAYPPPSARTMMASAPSSFARLAWTG